MENKDRQLYLLDAYALIYRAFFALNKNPRFNTKGLNTSAIMGFLNTLYDVLKNRKPSHIAVAFDVASPTQRQKDFADYKANREKMPDDLRASIPYIIEIIKAFNIPIFAVEGYEADDIIGTLSKKAEDCGFMTYMMTPDKDFGQLVTDHVFMLKPAKFGEPAQVWGVNEVCQRYGISNPRQLIDILGLWGDASDNIPGIPGVGEKTAAQLVARFGSVENVIANAAELKGKQRENVEQFAEQGLMSKMLATINTNAPVDFNEEQLRRKQPDTKRLLEIFDELEFRAFAKRFVTDMSMAGDANNTSFANEKNSQVELFSQITETDGSLELFSLKQSISTVQHSYKMLDGYSDLNRLADEVLERKCLAFSLIAEKDDLRAIGFAVESHKAFCLKTPLSYDETKAMLEEVRAFFENDMVLKIGHDLKPSISLLERYGIELKQPFFDTMLAHYVVDPEQRHGIDYLAETLLDYSVMTPPDSRKTIDMFEESTLRDYAAESADLAMQLYEKLAPKLADYGVEKLFDDIEMPLVPVLSRMELNGVMVDSANLQQISSDFAVTIGEIENRIYDMAGERFNIGSPRQLGEVLFDKMKIKEKAKKTKTGQYATGEEVLLKLAPDHPIVSEIMDYRSLTKLKSTYLDALPALIDPNDGLIHTTFNQAVTATGRLSSNNPNLQNIPVRTEQGREIRKAFVPRGPEYTLMAADYSQIELRIIAHLSEDPVMKGDFNLGNDIHAATAAKVYHVDIKDVTKQQRSKAKAVNFGIIYGMSAFGLAERLEISRSEAAEIIKSYFAEYAGIKEYLEKSVALAREKGYAETITGRRRYLRDINATNSVVRGFAERNAVNAPIQGSSADMIKIAMIAIHKEMQRLQMRSKMILQVHDELVFDAHLDEVNQLKSLVEEKMVNAMPLSVPVLVEINTGDNWLEAH